MDVDTLERKAIGGDTAVVVRGLVIEKVRRDVSLYVGCVYCKKRMIDDDHGNLRCERRACVNPNTNFLVRISFVESATGYVIWLTLLDHIGRDTCLSSLRKVKPGCNNYNVTHLDVLN